MSCGVPDESPLVAAARTYPGVRFQEGVRDPLLVSMAEDCADLLAARGTQGYRRDGHPAWDERYGKIWEKLRMKPVEVTAQADRNLTNAPLVDVATNMYDAWQQSEGHWEVIEEPHARYGDAMAKGTEGVWFGCIITADPD